MENISLSKEAPQQLTPQFVFAPESASPPRVTAEDRVEALRRHLATGETHSKLRDDMWVNWY